VKVFKRSSIGVGLNRIPHQHITFLNEDRGYGVSAVSAIDGHYHEWRWVDPVEGVPEQQDPNTGELIPGQPPQPGYWECSPSEIDGHVHQDGFVEIPRKPTDASTEDEIQVVSQVMEAFSEWYDLDWESIEAGRESEDFFAGKQWPDGVPGELAKLRRACITINQIEPRISKLSGHERRNRTELRLLPIESSDQRKADVFNIVLKVLLDNCNFWAHKSQSFLDLAIAGKGCYNIRVTKENDLRGELVLERFPWDQHVSAPTEYPDASDAEGFCKYRWYSLSKAKRLWKEHAEKLEGLVDSINRAPFGVDVTQPGNESGGPWNGGERLFEGRKAFDAQRKDILVVECHRFEYLDCPVISHPDEDVYFNALGWDKADIKEAMGLPGFSVVTQSVKKVRISKVAGGSVLLSDEFPADLPSDEFYTIPMYCYRMRGKYWGLVEGVKGAQQEVNKFASLAIDVGNRLGGAENYFYDDNTFADQQEEQRFQNYSSEPGATFKVLDVNKIPRRTEGAQFPAQLIQMMQWAAGEIEQRFNLEPTNIGANTSGQAILQAQQMKLMGVESLFEAQRLAMIRIGRLLIPIIQKYYPPERLLRILRAYHSTHKNVMIQDQDLDQISDEDILELLSTNDIEKFDLTVTESSYSPSARAAIATVFMDLLQKGVQVPMPMVLRYLDMPDRERKELEAQMQQQQQDQNDASARVGDAEIEKTLVAKGIIPPATAQRFGLPPQNSSPEAQGAPTGGITEAPQASEVSQQSQSKTSLPVFNVNISPPIFNPPNVTVQVDGSRPGTKVAQFADNGAGGFDGQVSDLPSDPNLTTPQITGL